MANPHFQNMILWAGNTDATEAKKDQPMFMPYPSDQTFYGYFNDFMTYTATDWTITSTDGGGDSGEVIQATSSAGGALLIPSLTSSDIPSAPSGAKMGGTLTMAMASEPNYLDPADWWGSSDIQMIDQIFDSLIQFGFDFKPYPRLAESWTVSDDGKVWTFNLRSGVKFHDGHELTSADVKYSYERILDPDTKAVRRSALTNNAKIESISTPDVSQNHF